MARPPAVGALLLGLWFGALGGPVAVLVPIVGVASVEVPFLEGSFDRVEDQVVKAAFFLQVFLNREDSGLVHVGTGANWPGLVA